jgi:hypothetical protein
MYASMTAATRFPRSSQKRLGRLGTPLRPCMGLRVLMYVVVETLFTR